jgi:outer membrane protein
MKQNSIRQYIGAGIDQMRSEVIQAFSFCLALVISLFPLDKIYAQPLLTLEDAVAIALENNYDIRLAKSDSALLALDYSYRNAVFFPQLNANVGTTWTDNNQKQEFTDGTSREGDVSTNNLNGSVALNWVLFDGLRMFALRDKAEAYASLGGLNMRNQIVNTVSEVINAYYLIVRQKQMLKAIEEQMSLSQVRVDLSQRKLEIGLGTKQEYLQSQIDLNAQKSAKLHQETYIRELKVILNQRIDPGPDGTSNLLSTDYEVTDSIPIDFVMELEDIRSQLELSNPTLQISRKNLDIASINLQEAKSGRWPTVQFNSAYNFSRTNNDLALNPFLPIFNQNKGFNYGFSASIPILNYRNTDRLVEQSKLNIQYQSLQYASERSRLTLNVINAYNIFQLQKDVLELEESNILLARENVSITQETYRLGTSTFIQLREAEKSLEDAYDRLIAARYNAKVAETELMRLRGEIVK